MTAPRSESTTYAIGIVWVALPDLGLFLSRWLKIIISILIIIMHRKSPDGTIAGKRFKERSDQRMFRFSHSSVVSDTKFQAERIGRMAGNRVPEI